MSQDRSITMKHCQFGIYPIGVISQVVSRRDGSFKQGPLSVSQSLFYPLNNTWFMRQTIVCVCGYIMIWDSLFSHNNITNTSTNVIIT